jgi:uncharacterized protein (DUF608 family)
MVNQNEKLWNGQYYVQIPEAKPANDYNNGRHSDQLLGQWWAHMLGLGYLYPPERVRRALEAVMEHNFREKFAGFKQAPRRYIPDEEGRTTTDPSRSSSTRMRFGRGLSTRSPARWSSKGCLILRGAS